MKKQQPKHRVKTPFGHEVDLRKIPDGITHIRFWNSY